jgi:PAS domain S-box-containing protein
MRDVPVKQLIGRSVAEVLPDVFAQLEPALGRALAGESVSEIEVRVANSRQADGYITVLASYQPIRDAAGEIVGISVAAIDITERKRIEQALAESDDYFRQTLAQDPVFLWTANAEGMVTDIGPEWLMLTGISKEESLGDGWRKGLHPEDGGRALQVWQEVVRTGQPYDIEFRCRRGDGSWRWIRARAMARRGASAEIIHWHGTLEVIDDRRTESS